jgi:hypothetical protein
LTELVRQVVYSIIFESVNRLWEADAGRFDAPLLNDLLEVIEWCKGD